jgi:indolepyruvate ferredoxin oxidoreductase
MSDEPEKYQGVHDFAPGVDIRHREQLEATQRELRVVPGVTILIYDQTCAAEKRRRRKRGTYPDPDLRVFINELVCEGCGDCSVKSNCLAVVPVETEFGRKRAIDQFSCNKDYSCLDGFCPSLVTVRGGKVRRGRTAAAPADAFAGLPEPALPALARPYGILVAGVGGTGVVTIGALVGMAAHLEGKGATVLDMTGLAQKGGAVMSHIRIGQRQENLHSARITTGEANLVLGCDIIVTVSDDALSKTAAGVTRAIVNSGRAITGDFLRNPDHAFPVSAMEQSVVDAVGPDQAEFLDAGRLATLLLGHSIATNIFMLGYAWQKGLVPLSAEALLRAIELNGAAVEENRRAFNWGRRAAHDPAGVEAIAQGGEAKLPTHRFSESLDETIARRVAFLTAYQNAAYAERYAALLRRVRASKAAPLAEAVARNYFKLLAYKDEYEVARLFAFEGDYRLDFHVTLPWQRPAHDGTEPKKRRFGPWLMPAMRLLAKFKFLRGSAFDPFARIPERKEERRLIADYERLVDGLIARYELVDPEVALALTRLPESIRGYGPVKERSITQARATQAELEGKLLRRTAEAPARAA